MANITYLLGAGASANALPLIRKSPTSNILGLSDELKLYLESGTTAILSLNTGWEGKNINILKDIIKGCIEFDSPDLYAKFLLETGDFKNYRILKTLISNYFIYKQDLKNCFDYRALTFLTTITQNKKKPDNVKILSWNYDT